jgi:hypothetical protein
MADFDQSRDQIRKSREQRDAAASAIAAANERLKKIANRQTELGRVFNDHDQQAIAERDKLAREKEAIQTELGRLGDAKQTAISAEAAALKDWAVFTDPVEGIRRLNDDTPILLMPVRLETRFKSVGVAGIAAPASQLWVRIYPDDCWIDSFDPVLTDTEVTNAKAYWAAIWMAGGIEDQQRGAWRALANSHGSGRASWIVQQYRPVNIASPPVKTRPQDVILVIPTENALAVSEAAAASTYWRDVWLADGDAGKIAAARAALDTAVGAERATEIIAQYQASNFADPLAAGLTKKDVFVSVAFVVFPPVDTKQSAWSSAPKMNILPDRFVFIGYDGSASPVIEVGNPVPSPLIAALDPSAPKDQQLQHDEHGNLIMPEELKWISDFNRAVEVGMGLRIDLTPAQAANGFNRVLVIGLRLNADAQAAKTELETLLRHHSYGRTGIEIVPQGTPTNNTDVLAAGHSRLDDPDQSFNDLKAPLFTPQSGWLDKKDGQWLAEYLGIDPTLFANTHRADSTDQLTARAMNIALWPATLGYWMETMMSPVFTPNAIERTRDFFGQYIVAGGAVPALRIGNQPYGVLPATALSRITWMNPRRGVEGNIGAESTLGFLRQLYQVLKAIDADWRAIVPQLSFTGKANADPHETLLDIVGLHPGSVEWSQRYAESLQTLYNRLSLQGFGGIIQAIILAAQRAASRGILTHLGYAGATDPPILEKIFSGAHNLLRGGVVDDKPLSETATIRAFTTGGQNYIQWLIDAAKTSLDALYQQNGFKDDQPPAALLFLMLRHALQLGYHDVSIRLFENAGIYTPQMSLAARSDYPFLHIQTSIALSESRYQPLLTAEPRITGSATLPVNQYIASRLTLPVFEFYLRQQLDALERLKLQSTARLERAFADHIDCCSYRLDAWLLGLLTFQLTSMRGIQTGSESAPRQGIYLGAYAWLEDVRPEAKQLTPVQLQDPDLIADFGSPDEPPLMRDSANEGFIHAPSLNHAVAAAVLRNGFISDATPQNRETLAVNLTSERVRTALGMIEGIRAGQSLSDLLGYQFERGLHDRHTLAEVDQYIYILRKAFPLRADRLQATKTDPTISIQSVEARNVIDGLALAEQMKSTGQKTYPFGKDGLPDPPQPQKDAINAEADRLLESYDAVADLALSEGVYQAVLGNYDRVASTYDAYARGNFPPEPDVIRTPFNGIGLTHRVALHLEAGADPAVSPLPGLDMTPRTQAEPALNKWLASVMPALDQVGCVVSFREAAGGIANREITLRELALQPSDFVAIVTEDPNQAMTELDDRVVAHALANFNPRPDVPIQIQYMQKVAAPFTVFEVMPLVRALRGLATKSRSLKATDLSLMNEATSGQDAQPFVDKQRLVIVRAAMDTLRGNLVAFQAQLDGPLSDLANRKGEILAHVDDYVHDLIPLLMRTARFVIVQAGWGFAYDFKRRTFSAILDQSAGLVNRWNDKLAEFDAKIAAVAGAPTDQEKFDLLAQAERAISTVATTPLPATPAVYQTDLVTVKRPAFVAKRDQFAALQDTTRTAVSLLLNDAAALLPVTDFDFVDFSFADRENEIVLFAEDARNVVKTVIAEIDRRLKASQDLFDAHDAAASPVDQVRALEDAAKALLGADFRIFPEFPLSTEQGDELENAFNASNSGELLQYLTNPPDPATPPLDFPVDTWLYGVARVREKLRAWEQTIMFAGSFGRPEPDLLPMQLPFTPGERWFALEFPPGQALDKDHLLYTAHFASPFNKAVRQCGLLLEEWSELIPGSSADTGITFHFDRPNCEAPQSMLLVTPTDFRGAWQWNDLVDALNETLDFAKRRAIEPKHIDATPYAPFLPATITATQVFQLTIAANLALNNKVAALVRRD